MEKIVAIVPAFNEEPRISVVLDVLTGIEYIADIIVVNDGSEDDTGEVARGYDVRLIEHEENLGKGAALQTGINNSDGADVFLFLDADLIGLKEKHVDQLLQPLINGDDASMSIGVFRGGTLAVDLAQNLFPVLNGQRALRRDLIEKLPDLSWSRFGVEILLNRYCELMGEPIEWVTLKNISHWTKEQKDGFTRGFKHRMKMYKECMRCQLTYKKILKPVLPEGTEK